jgi:putative transposase
MVKLLLRELIEDHDQALIEGIDSHQPTRQREHARKGFRSGGAAQRLLAAFGRISPRFRPRSRGHLITASI